MAAFSRRHNQNRARQGLVVPKATITQFLDKPRFDSNQYKQLGEGALDKRRLALPAKPPIWFKLRQVQRVCFLLGVKFRRFGFLLDTGMGKTLLSIALVRYFRRMREVKCVLVLVPNRANKAEWAREIRKHSPNTPFCILTGSSSNKWDQLQSIDAAIVVETYAGLLNMVCGKVVKKERNRMEPKLKLIKLLLKYIDGLILDESTSAKTRGKLPFRICRQISKRVGVVFALTGTPFGRDPTDLWGQMYLIDQGETLGKTLGLFRAAFFTSTANHWGGLEHTFQKRMQGKLNQILAHRSISYEAQESDLPPLVSIVKNVALPADAQTYVDRAIEAIKGAHGNYQEMKNAFVRMRQISSGFLGYYDDEQGSKAEYEFKPNRKLELLTSIIESVRPDKKIIVFHEYTFSGSMICRELDRLKIGHVRVYGKTKDPDALLEQYNTDPECRVLVLNNSAGSFGLNLQITQYGIYYESPVSPIIRKQTRRRFERQGSPHDKVFLYDLVMQGTFDERILAYLKQGEDMFQAIINGKEKMTPEHGGH